ncbi:thiamine pyrophosphate-binding protein [Mycobacterium sp. NPDC003449]
MAKTHGGDVLARALREEGVDTVFTLCGNHTLKAYQGLHDADITLVDTRTEAGAVMAADAYARATRRPAVALVTGGPGHTNALTGLITAHACDSPVVLLSGQVDLHLKGRGAQQEIDQVGSAAPLCKWAREVTDVNELAPLLHEAFTEAMSGITGAVHLSIPADVLADVPDEAAPAARHRAAADTQPDPAMAKQVADILATARRPVVIAGTGAYMARCEQALQRLLDISGIPLFTVDQARGMIADDAPGVLGYADPSLNRVAREIARADVVLLLGKRLDFRLRFGEPSVIAADATLIDVHAVGAETDANRAREISIGTDIGAFIARLADEARSRSWDHRWRAELAALPRLPDIEEPPAGDVLAGPFHPLAVSRAIRAALPHDAAIVLDGGDFVQWCRSDLTAPGPGRWLRLGPMSTCGAGTPLAMGLKRAVPERPVVLITGDGSFGYYLIEFEAAARQGLPFVAIVGHNNAWGLENNLQRGLYGEDYALASELSATRFDRVIAALGGYGERVTDLRDFGAALHRALDSGLPACLEVPVNRTPSPLTEAVIARGGEV